MSTQQLNVNIERIDKQMSELIEYVPSRLTLLSKRPFSSHSAISGDSLSQSKNQTQL